MAKGYTMARENAILKLYQRLQTQREALTRTLAREMSSGLEGGHGDTGDYAIFDNEQEMHSQLAALESRELGRIDKALNAIRNGVYGNCEHCEKRIPITRLKALPHTTSCIHCQREHETDGFLESDADWESACEYQARENDRELTSKDVKILED